MDFKDRLEDTETDFKDRLEDSEMDFKDRLDSQPPIYATDRVTDREVELP